jgi:hypothetical protein
MKYTWLSECVSHGGEYLAFMATQQLITDGDIDADDVKAMRLDALWETLQGAGKLWGQKVNWYKHLLLPLHQAVHGATAGGAAAADTCIDPLLNHQLPLMVAAIMQAISAQRSGEGSYRHVLESSNQTVALYGGRDAAASAELCAAQGVLLRDVLSEAGRDYDTQRGGLDYAKAWTLRFVRPASDSPARLAWQGVRAAHRDQARRRRFQIGGAQPHKGDALPGCQAFAAPQGGGAERREQQRAERERQREQQLKLERDARDQKAQEERKARHAAGAKVEDTTISYGPWTYERAKVPADCCELHAIGLKDGNNRLCPNGAKDCTRKHRPLTDEEWARLKPADQPAGKRQREAERGGGGGKRGGGGGGRGGGGAGKAKPGRGGGGRK